MEKLDIEIKLPRITNKQRNRANTPADSPEQYYLRTLFVPLTENILEDLRERFINKKNESLFLLIQLIPSYILKLSKDKSSMKKINIDFLYCRLIYNYLFYILTFIPTYYMFLPV